MADTLHRSGLIDGDPFNIGLNPAKVIQTTTILISLPGWGSALDPEEQLSKLRRSILALTQIECQDLLQFETCITTEF
ncbi:hypothetical protein DDE82_008335 [Stemphylium lycopersici]|nr:hypothetical protein DDE82_008335 [Stemphylium lycopersici]